MVPGVTKGVARVEPRWEDGIFLGVSDRSDELHVGTERGMHKVRTVRRREATERVDLKFLREYPVCRVLTFLAVFQREYPESLIGASNRVYLRQT